MDLKQHQRACSLLTLCLQEDQSAKQIKVLEKEAKIVYKKLAKSCGKLVFQNGVWEGMRVIDFAVSGGYHLMLHILVGYLQVDPNIPNGIGNRSTLHCAAEAGQTLMVEALLNVHKCPVDVMDICNSTPLNIAISNGKNDTVELLLNHGASTESKNFYGLPIHCAAFLSNTCAVRMLHEVNPATTNSVEFDFCTPIAAAISTGSIKCIEFLSEVTDATEMPLMYKVIACIVSEEAALKIINILLQSGVNPNRYDEALFEGLPIILASKRGWRSAVELLLTQTNPVDGVDWTVEGLIRHVSNEDFKRMDQIQKEVRVDGLKARLLQELDERHYLASHMICLMLHFEMVEDDWDSWFSLSGLLCRLAEASVPVDCSKMELLSIGSNMLRTNQLAVARVIARGCLVLQPDDEECRAFHREVSQVMEFQDAKGTGTSGRR